MRATYTPWARAALSDLERERIKWHLTKGLRLDVGSVNSPFRFTVRLYDSEHELVAGRTEVLRSSLFEVILGMLADAGERLMTEREFVGLKEAIDA